jgi:Ca2+-binding EF-hand superfamily protein
MRGCVFFPQDLIAASDLYGEGYVDMDEFLAAMVANSSYSKTKDAVSGGV